MGILIKGMDEIPEDGAVLVVKHDNGKAYIKHACTYGYSMELVKLPAVQTTGKKARTTDDWIPVKWHYCTDADRDEYGFGESVAGVFDCEMPNDGQEILVTTSHGYVEKDVCYIEDGYSLDSGYDWLEDIKAWQPLPEPYRGGDE